MIYYKHFTVQDLNLLNLQFWQYYSHPTFLKEKSYSTTISKGFFVPLPFRMFLYLYQNVRHNPLFGC